MIGPERKKRTKPQTDEEWWTEWHANQKRRKEHALRQMSIVELEDELARRREVCR